MAAVSKKCGPWGKEGSPTWSLELGLGETIEGVIIWDGGVVDGIGFSVTDKDGKTTTKNFRGQGGNRQEIALKPDEHITHISGTYGVYKKTGHPVISTINIHTNSRPSGYGPYGKQTEVSELRTFSSAQNEADSVVVGFFGCVDGYLASIGIYIAEDRVEKIGPWGNQSPTNWDMKLSAGETIKQVNIRGAIIVEGIGFVIADSSGKETTKHFGGRYFGKLYTVKLGPNEHITHISGTYGVYAIGLQCTIASIKIHTNYCPDGYGPFGGGLWNVHSFSTKYPSHVAVGFFGRALQRLESIGTYVKPYRP